jgi:glutamate formiminotransferase/formiminotetrahydrofolate cyclodeaminase
MNRLLALVDEDTAAFDRIMAAIGMPKGSEEEKAARAAALEAATLYATEVPLKTMKAALEVFPIVKAMALEGNPASVSDAGVGALAARSAVLGAQLNVRINAAGLADRDAAERLCAEAAEIAKAALKAEAEVLDIVNTKI